MRITSKGRYAVTALIDLATSGSDAPVALQGISERQGISLSYLEHLFGRLRRHNIVKSARGPGGGYRLGTSGAQISLAEIISAVDNPRNVTEDEDQDGSQMCNTDALWNGLNEVWYAYLSTVSLQQLIDLNHQDMAEATPATVCAHSRNEDPPPPARAFPGSRSRTDAILARD